jgi:hypothetical protein
VQHRRDFRRFEREDRILVAKEDILHEIQGVTSSDHFQLTCGLELLKIIS